MPKSFAESAELIRRRKQLHQLDMDACFAVAILVGGVASWISYLVAERKMAYDERGQSEEEINCTRAILHVLHDESARELLIDGLNNELSSLLAAHNVNYGTFAKARKLIQP